MSHRGSETQFELTTIERLEQLGYRWLAGPDIEREQDEVILRDLLRDSLARRYSMLTPPALDEAITKIALPTGVDTVHRNLDFHQHLVGGFEVFYETEGKRVPVHVHPIDWDEAGKNDFLVVNQLPIHGANDRRPDLIVYINGLPLIVFELKNPYSVKPTVDEALNQISHYRLHIPQLFEPNALVIVSDGNETLHGMWTAEREWYAPWKSIDGSTTAPGTLGSMKVLLEGLFQKERLLSYLRHFIVFEIANEKVTKKGAKYHQFFAVRAAVERTKAAFLAVDDKRLGVVWHTTGSGKSLTMVFLVGILRRLPELGNPTIVLQVDRTDLDDQLHDHFVVASTLVGAVKHAESREQLRDLLASGGGEIIFTTTEKFGLKSGADGRPIESEHPVLSERENVIVIADEAHRSQYGFLKGYARYLAEALPNAKRLGFTGTPISFGAADTVAVFGDYIHTYDIRQSQEDKATVPIWYAPRLAKLHLATANIEEDLLEVLAAADSTHMGEIERKKASWAQLAAGAGAKDRVAAVAKDLLNHYLDRTKTLAGKALIVCMTRENCVRMFDALRALPDCPEVKVVMTGNLGEDPATWSEAGHLTTKHQRDSIKERMKDEKDPLAMVIVCDMWLTGTDIPCLHTLYVDKPMRGHNVIQAISRVNRVFSDKPHGLIVDYIGIGEQLREATATYTRGGGSGEPAPDIGEQARPPFFEALDAVRECLPSGHDWGAWRKLSRIEFEDLHSLAYGHLAEDDALRDNFLDSELWLTNAFLLVMHLDDCRVFADEVICFQRIRGQVGKMRPGGSEATRDLDRAVRDLVDDHVQSEGVVDIFKLAGIDKPDISILDETFLQNWKDRPLEALRLKLLERLLRDEIVLHERRNLAKARSFQLMLEEMLKKYHNRVIDAAAIVEEMIRMRRAMEADARRAVDLGLGEDELAFYDTIAEIRGRAIEMPVLRDIVHDVVGAIKRNLKVDWTEPHREDVHAAIRAAVRRALRRRDVTAEDIEVMTERVMTQAEALYADWPLAA
ncbi:MAG: type I restriction endonuclease subunit R [Gemmatimonadaceae bacterium]|nr:type I restriction endonuclease subunit R [Gemmatimonadaceae bacterium]MBA3557369.1 type I restriction endonuclease subunit R [Gemmatimonadaceae bacterium]